MIYLELFIGFLIIGLLSFGGAYGAIPIMKDVALHFEWIDESMLTNMIGVSESTPGPIMVNLATFIGNQVGGPLGAAIATITVVLPAFVIILLVMVLFKKAMEKKWFQNILKGLQPTIIGIIIATGLMMCLETIANVPNEFNVDYKLLFIATIIATIIVLTKKLFKKNCSPILLIIVFIFCIPTFIFSLDHIYNNCSN